MNTRIQILMKDDRRFLINAVYADILEHNGIQTAEGLWNLPSEPVKNAVKTRGTARTFLKTPDSRPEINVYIKRYLKPSLRDRVKCALSLKPVFPTGALHEWDALCRFHELGLNTMIPIAAGTIGRETCNLTLGITDYVRASDLFATELQDQPERRIGLVVKIAKLMGRMHAAGLAHQDFYLVHLFVKPEEDDAVYLIDLQRTIMQKKLSRRWQIKDLAQIHFAMSPLITSQELLSFRETYTGMYPLASSAWEAVEAKAVRIRRHTGKHRI